MAHVIAMHSISMVAYLCCVGVNEHEPRIMFQARLLQIHHIAILAQEGARKSAEERRKHSKCWMIGEKELPYGCPIFVQRRQHGKG